MEYQETQPTTNLFRNWGFALFGETLSRLDSFSNLFQLLDWGSLLPPSSSLRGFYLELPPLFLDLLGVDRLSAADGGARDGSSSRFSLHHIGTFSDWNSQPHLVEFQLGAATAPLFSAPTMSGLYAGSEWAERECWDMFGILFEGNYDLRRILTDYGFAGFPLRRDFPVVGFVETHYDEENFQLRLERISLAQEMRSFLFQSGATVI